MINITRARDTQWVRKLIEVSVKHAPEIAGFLGISGFIAAIGITYKNAKDIHEGIEEKDYKKVAKKSLPVVALAGASTACVCYSMKENNKRLAAIATAYSLTDAAYSELKEQTRETLGDKRADLVEKDIQEKRVNQAMSNVNFDSIEDTGKGQQIFCELLTGRVFRSDVNIVRRAINEVNSRFDAGRWDGITSVSLADIHDELGIERGKLDALIIWKVDPEDERNSSRIQYVLDAMRWNDEPISTIDYRGCGITDAYGDRFLRID